MGAHLKTNNALRNLKTIMKNRKINCGKVTNLILGHCRYTARRDSIRRRVHRLTSGDTRIGLDDVIMLSEALKVEPEILAFGDIQEIQNDNTNTN